MYKVWFPWMQLQEAASLLLGPDLFPLIRKGCKQLSRFSRDMVKWRPYSFSLLLPWVCYLCDAFFLQSNSTSTQGVQIPGRL